MYSAGIDIGSVATKGVLFNGEVTASVIIPTGWSPREASQQALAMVLDRAGTGRAALKSIIATGYGRVSADFASRAITEITCHARGAFALHPGIRTVLDIGGQDAKVIRLDDSGAVTDFTMNDKCAAGTGRFLEVMARILGTEVQDLDSLAEHGEPASISSMCAVFAESEVISLMAKGAPREAIARGVLEAIAERAIGLLGRHSPAGAIAFTGGLSRSSVLVGSIQQRLGMPVFTSPSSQIAGALGGAVIGWN
jgi:predicted CoA-substrate-specific enzyme activase